MARSKKLEKNLSKVQDMLDGKNDKIQVGYGNTSEEIRKVGDTWTDSDGYEWEQKEGFKVKKSVLPARGIADECSDCKTYIIKQWDKDSYKHNGRCYYCQIDFESQYSRTFQTGVNRFAEFEGEKGAKKWAKLSKKKKEDFLSKNLNDHEKYQLKRLEEYIKAFKKEEKLWKKEMQEEKVFDRQVANALANENVEMTVNKNKTMTK
tara:strand:+ start:712 stop:1329 length:618 start_codon:yes stop_codon:yes gene_type:complete